jgi:hypothetical protein
MTLECHSGICLVKSRCLTVVELIARDLMLPFDISQFFFEGTDMLLGNLNLIVEVSIYLLIMAE